MIAIIILTICFLFIYLSIKNSIQSISKAPFIILNRLQSFTRMQGQSSKQTRSKLLSHESECRELLSQLADKTNKKNALATMKIQSLKTMSASFVKYLLLSSLEANTQCADVDAVFDQLQAYYEIKAIDFRVLLGVAIHNCLNSMDTFKQIRNRICDKKGNVTIAIEESDSDDDITVNFANQQFQVETSNFYSKQSNLTPKGPSTTTNPDSSIQIQYESDNQLDVSISNFEQGGQMDLNSQIFDQENEEIISYLYKLSKATTQLSYLCQRMKWAQPQFIQTKSKINEVLFSCVAKVNTKFKTTNFYELESQCLGAVSKKQAKRIASLFLLRKIYNRFPEVWKKFKKCRQDNPGIQQSLNANNEQLFKSKKFSLVQGQLFKQEQKNIAIHSQQSKQIIEYLDGLSSFKSQINVFQGKYNKRVTQVEFQREKQDQLSLWPVRASLNDGKDLIQAEARESSKKKAEELCCRELLYQLYIRSPARWQEFKKFKTAKGLQ